MTTVAPDKPGLLKASVKGSDGALMPNVAVTFTSTDKTAVFVPASGTALTDANGLAVVTLKSGSQAGAFTATATATLGGKAVTGNISYQVSFPVLTLSALRITPSTLAAGGTASVAVTVLNGTNPFAPAQSVVFSSPCLASGKATISSPVITVLGVASTSYTDKGCGGADVITASTTLGEAIASQAGTISVLSATAGQVIFVSASPENIAIKGTGGPGRQETSTVTFKVLDKNGNPVSGQRVSFSLNTTAGGLTLNPATATTGADGTVSTVVAAGTINTPVRVTATLDGTSISTVSDQLVISTGVPDQNSFSLSTEIYNVEGMNYDGCQSGIGSRVHVSLADHFNNPVPKGTAVSFTAEGGTVEASCLTGDPNELDPKGSPGKCLVHFCSANPRPKDGRVTILAYALGEESFVDDPNLKDSVNRYDPGEAFQDLCEPFRNDRALTNKDANSTLIDSKKGPCPLPAANEPYIDSNGDGLYNATGDGKYNGVLAIDPVTQKTVADGTNLKVHVRSSLVQVLSTSQARIDVLNSADLALSHCTDGVAFNNTIKNVLFAVRDTNPTVFPGNEANTTPLYLPVDLPGNILPAGTQIDFTFTLNGVILGNNSYTVTNSNEPSAAAWIYPVALRSPASQDSQGMCSNRLGSGLLTVTVTTPNKTVTTRSFVVTD